MRMERGVGSCPSAVESAERERLVVWGGRTGKKLLGAAPRSGRCRRGQPWAPRGALWEFCGIVGSSSVDPPSQEIVAFTRTCGPSLR